MNSYSAALITGGRMNVASHVRGFRSSFSPAPEVADLMLFDGATQTWS